jgi:hypothetical protein
MNDKWQKIRLQKILQKIVAAVAREQGGNVVDLAQVKRNTRIVILRLAIEEVWQAFDAGLIEADPAEEMLRYLEAKLSDEMIFRRPSIAELRAMQPAAHRAARGVRKIRGAK